MSLDGPTNSGGMSVGRAEVWARGDAWEELGEGVLWRAAQDVSGFQPPLKATVSTFICLATINKYTTFV